MNFNAAFENSINYIENHLCGSIDCGKAAQFMGCSEFHYQRMFSYLAGVPLSEYIRRRKMTLAAFDLQKTDEIEFCAVQSLPDSAQPAPCRPNHAA